jgi:hypothetical protein
VKPTYVFFCAAVSGVASAYPFPSRIGRTEFSGYGDAVAELANAIAFSSMCEWLEYYKGGDLAYWKVTEAAGRLWIGWQGQNSGRFSGALISRLTLEFATRQIVL